MQNLAVSSCRGARRMPAADVAVSGFNQPPWRRRRAFRRLFGPLLRLLVMLSDPCLLFPIYNATKLPYDHTPVLEHFHKTRHR